ncbi:MAG: hypothetical protein WDA00_06505 [Eubacteriales bacterium]
MSNYTKQALAEARASLASTLQKCEKIQAAGRLPSPQKTLNDRRVKALQIALALLDKEMEAGHAD